MPGDTTDPPLKAFDPAIAPKPSEQMAAEGEREGPVLSDDDRASGLEVECGRSDAIERDVTLLPPD
jgi:hypothetical protein